MVYREDVTGSKFSMLTAIRRVAPREKRTFWLFMCDCGTEKEISLVHVKGGKTTSCGCFLRAYLKSDEHAKMCGIASRLPRTHGMSNSSEYYVWKTMRQRCQNKNSHDYRWYGALGVAVCERWESFENFYADMGPANGLTIDRINPSKNYTPENCRWTTWEIQRQNKRKTFDANKQSN